MCLIRFFLSTCISMTFYTSALQIWKTSAWSRSCQHHNVGVNLKAFKTAFKFKMEVRKGHFQHQGTNVLT